MLVANEFAAHVATSCGASSKQNSIFISVNAAKRQAPSERFDWPYTRRSTLSEIVYVRVFSPEYTRVNDARDTRVIHYNSLILLYSSLISSSVHTCFSSHVCSSPFVSCAHCQSQDSFCHYFPCVLIKANSKQRGRKRVKKRERVRSIDTCGPLWYYYDVLSIYTHSYYSLVPVPVPHQCSKSAKRESSAKDDKKQWVGQGVTCSIWISELFNLISKGKGKGVSVWQVD